MGDRRTPAPLADAGAADHHASIPLPPARDGALRVFVCFSLAQGLNRPITPMGLAAFRVIGGSLARLFGVPARTRPTWSAPPPAFAAVGGRVFVDVTAVLRNPLGRAVATRVLDIMEARTGVVLRELFADPAFAPVPRGRRGRCAGSCRCSCTCGCR